MNLPMIIAGPCAVENHTQMQEIAKCVADAGVEFLRAGAYKPRTSPYDFQGLGEPGLAIMAAAAADYGLKTVSEVISCECIPIVSEYIDILQVGARNMQNFALLKKLGKQRKPVLLKRAACATYKELLLAAEYILSGGNDQVILCERGIRTFENMTRNTLDLSIVPILRELTKLPIIVDPSHAVGVRAAVPALARAAIAVGADGVMLEVHPQPDQSISDAKQALYPHTFSKLVPELHKIAKFNAESISN